MFDIFLLQQAAGCLLKSKQFGVPISSLGSQVNNSHPFLRSNLSPWAGTSVIQRPGPVGSTRSRSSSTSLASNSLQLYQQLYDVFGDSLGPRTAHNNWQDAAVTKNNHLRMQPFAHAYFPLRPLARDVNVIKEMIIKTRQKLRLVRPQTPAHGTKRKRTTSESGSAHKTSEKRTGTKAKRICMTVSPARARLQQVPMDLDPEEPNPSRSTKRGGHKAFEVPGTQAHGDRNHSKRVTGRIHRKFRRINPSLNNTAKYDYHLGVTL